MESAFMVAVGTVLSVLKLIDMPYGGSVTVGCIIPVVIIAYRYGFRWGLVTGFVFGLLQQVLGIENISYLPIQTWQAVVALVIFDYIAAFMAIGFAGLFRKLHPQPVALMFGAVFACILRYICHVISGATVWAGMPIPDKAALVYSIGYNGTYMLPETIVTAIVAYYIGSVLDFGGENIIHLTKEKKAGNPVMKWLAGLILAFAMIFDIKTIFRRLQNGDTGEFDLAGFAKVNWTLILIVTVICIVISAVLYIKARKDSTSSAG